MKEKIMEFFIQNGAATGLTNDADLFSGGYINSLFAFEMIVYLEDAFGVKIGDDEITEDNFRTIDAIAAMVRRAMGESA